MKEGNKKDIGIDICNIKQYMENEKAMKVRKKEVDSS